MMMPANFTAVNSEVVYGGASLLDTLGDMAAPIWNASNVRTFNTNLLTIISNTWTGPLLTATVGTMFGGNWGKDGDKLFDKDEGTVTAFFKNIDGTKSSSEMGGLSKVMRVVSAAASIYTLGTTTAKVDFNDNVYGIKGKMM